MLGRTQHKICQELRLFLGISGEDVPNLPRSSLLSPGARGSICGCRGASSVEIQNRAFQFDHLRDAVLVKEPKGSDVSLVEHPFEREAIHHLL
jgi:hypothetical protein